MDLKFPKTGECILYDKFGPVDCISLQGSDPKKFYERNPLSTNGLKTKVKLKI